MIRSLNIIDDIFDCQSLEMLPSAVDFCFLGRTQAGCAVATALGLLLHRVPLVGADVAAELPEHLDVAVDALALCFDVELLQPLYDLPHRQPVLGVGLLLEDLLHVEDLELGLVVVRHGALTALALGLSDKHMCSFYCKTAVSDIRGVL